MRFLRGAAAAVIGLVILSVVLGAWYTIDQGERGVILRYGKIIGTADPGLHFKLPWIDQVERISIQSRISRYDNVHTYSRDQQPAVIILTVNYRIQPDSVDEVYTRFGGERGLVDRQITPRILQQFKNVFGQFNAVTAVTERARLNSETEDSLRSSIDGPVLIESVQVENIDYSNAYEASIEQRMLAEVEVQRVRQNLEKEKVQAEIAVTQAKGRADSQKAVADATAYQVRIQGEAEAEAIRARAAALSNNPLLIELTKAEKWNGTLPTTMLPDTAIPFIGTQAAGR